MSGKRNSAKPDIPKSAEHKPKVHACICWWFPKASAIEKSPAERQAEIKISRYDERLHSSSLKLEIPFFFDAMIFYYLCGSRCLYLADQTSMPVDMPQKFKVRYNEIRSSQIHPRWGAINAKGYIQ